MKKLLCLSVIVLMSTAVFAQEYTIEGKSLDDEDVNTVVVMVSVMFGKNYAVVDYGKGYQQLWKDGQKTKVEQITSVFGIFGNLGFTYKGSFTNGQNGEAFVFEKKPKKEE